MGELPAYQHRERGNQVHPCPRPVVGFSTMQSKATTVKAYLSELPEDRRKALEALRKVIRKNLDKGYEEGMQYGMIGYYVPHKVFPDGYHCDPSQPLPFGGMASQKNHMSFYFMCIYGDEKLRDWFIKAWKKTGKKLDMGKACIRFKKIDDLPLEVIGEAVRRVPVKQFIDFYTSTIRKTSKRSPAKTAKAKTAKAKAPASKKTTLRKKASAKKVGSKKAVVRKTTAKQAAKRKSASR
jgi:hypothetical protein